MKLLAIGVLLAFGIGSCAGSQLGDSPPVEFIEVPRTKIIREPAPPPVKIPVLSESCKKVLSLADQVARSAEKIYHSGEEQINILSDARKTLAAKTSTDEIDARQRRLHGETITYLYNLEEDLAFFELMLEECKDK